jgi:Arc/MetJ-type ribon-helix-helix transcriptional regulator
MEITLTPEQERLVAEVLQTGGYQSPNEVVGCALEMLRSEQQWLQEYKHPINEKIQRGFDQFERGEYFTAEEARAVMAQRKAAWLAEHKKG